MTRSDALEVLDVAWSTLAAGSTTFPRFVLTFEMAVRVVEEADDPLAPELRRIWGQVEIINALALDEGDPVSSSDLDNTAALVATARELLAGAGRSGRGVGRWEREPRPRLHLQRARLRRMWKRR